MDSETADDVADARGLTVSAVVIGGVSLPSLIIYPCLTCIEKSGSPSHHNKHQLRLFASPPFQPQTIHEPASQVGVCVRRKIEKIIRVITCQDDTTVQDRRPAV